MRVRSMLVEGYREDSIEYKCVCIWLEYILYTIFDKIMLYICIQCLSREWH